jgi:hypothetical protein
MLGYDGFDATEVRGFSGGIIVAWQKTNMHVSVYSKKFQYMHLMVQFNNGDSWFFTPIYASPNEDNRKVMWEDLVGIANCMNKAWLLAGDFNDMRR